MKKLRHGHPMYVSCLRYDSGSGIPVADVYINEFMQLSSRAVQLNPDDMIYCWRWDFLVPPSDIGLQYIGAY